MPLQDLTGQRFANLVAVSFVGRINKKSVWLWRCDCGGIKEAWASHVKSGATRSCGCLNLGSAQRRSDYHGMTETPEYRTWSNMLTRCNNPNHKDWDLYGGKGIKVCERWKDFKLFYADMGDRPKGTTIDRINSDDGYYKDNCRWATATQQAHNISRNRWIEHDGKKMILEDWAKFFGVTQTAVSKRIKNYGTLDGYRPRFKRKGVTTNGYFN